MLLNGSLSQVNGQKLLGLNHVEVVVILKELPRDVRIVCARRRADVQPQSQDVHQLLQLELDEADDKYPRVSEGFHSKVYRLRKACAAQILSTSYNVNENPLKGTKRVIVISFKLRKLPYIISFFQLTNKYVLKIAEI